jgi:hypothetical protein
MAMQYDEGSGLRSGAEPEWSFETTSKITVEPAVHRTLFLHIPEKYVSEFKE